MHSQVVFDDGAEKENKRRSRAAQWLDGSSGAAPEESSPASVDSIPSGSPVSAGQAVRTVLAVDSSETPAPAPVREVDHIGALAALFQSRNGGVEIGAEDNVSREPTKLAVREVHPVSTRGGQVPQVTPLSTAQLGPPGLTLQGGESQNGNKEDEDEFHEAEDEDDEYDDDFGPAYGEEDEETAVKAADASENADPNSSHAQYLRRKLNYANGEEEALAPLQGIWIDCKNSRRWYRIDGRYCTVHNEAGKQFGNHRIVVADEKIYWGANRGYVLSWSDAGRTIVWDSVKGGWKNSFSWRRSSTEEGEQWEDSYHQAKAYATAPRGDTVKSRGYAHEDYDGRSWQRQSTGWDWDHGWQYSGYSQQSAWNPANAGANAAAATRRSTPASGSAAPATTKQSSTPLGVALQAEVAEFVRFYGVDLRAQQTLQEEDFEVQRIVISRPILDCKNPSAAVIHRLRKAKRRSDTESKYQPWSGGYEYDGYEHDGSSAWQGRWPARRDKQDDFTGGTSQVFGDERGGQQTRWFQ